MNLQTIKRKTADNCRAEKIRRFRCILISRKLFYLIDKLGNSKIIDGCCYNNKTPSIWLIWQHIFYYLACTVNCKLIFARSEQSTQVHRGNKQRLSQYRVLLTVCLLTYRCYWSYSDCCWTSAMSYKRTTKTRMMKKMMNWKKMKTKTYSDFVSFSVFHVLKESFTTFSPYLGKTKQRESEKHNPKAAIN